MRDVLIMTIVVFGSLAALRRPWIGVVLWTWLSTMSPHRYAYGFAYTAPVAAMAGGATLLGLVAMRDRMSPFDFKPAVLLAMFMVWVTLSWLFGLDPDEDYWQWSKVIKIDLMIIVALMVIRTKEQIFAFAWVAVGSLAILGAKGGLFTLSTGGGYHVWGPPDSFIEDNNEFALALVITIPLLRFLQMQLLGFWKRQLMTGLMILCAASALGSQSRGALVAISAMGLLLWWRGRSRLLGGVVIAVVALSLLSFMPDVWSDRMETITNYTEDKSAMGRISAWWNAWNLAFHYPLGVGFNAARPELFARFSPYPDVVLAAHSIYFQVLGNHGFIGLFLFLAIWVTCWQQAGKLQVATRDRPETRWTADLGSMCQVALIGYGVGGAFLSLAYFDLPYNVLVLIVATRRWLARSAWSSEPVQTKGWSRVIPGLGLPSRT